MPSNKKNISFKKKNKRGGRGNPSMKVTVTQIPLPNVDTMSHIKGIYSVSSKNNEPEYYELNEDNTIHIKTKEEIDELKNSTENNQERAATSIQKASS